MLLLLSLLLIITGTIKAQATFPTFCSNLSEADCEIVQQSVIAMRELESINFNLQADLTVRNIPEVSRGAFTLHLTGEGSFAVDADSLLALQPEALDTDSGYTLMADVLRTVNADMSLTLDLPQELRDAMEQTLPATLTVDLLMTGGVVYINLTELATLDPVTIPSGWIGLDVAEFYSTVLPQMSDNDSTGFDMMPLIQILIEPDNLAQFMTIERLSDNEVSGQNMAVFEIQFDYVALAELPVFQDMLVSILSIVPSGQEVNVEAMLHVICEIYSGVSVIIMHNIGLDDLLIHDTNVDMTWDLTPFAEMSGEATAPVLDLNLVFTFEAFNTVFEVTVPESVEMLPLSEPNE